MDETRRTVLRWGGAAIVGVAALSVGLGRILKGNAISPREVNTFSRSFSERIDSGTGLVSCLNIAAEEQKNPRFRAILEDVRGEVEQGSTLSRALSRHPELFDVAYVQEVRQGEKAGRLEESLQRLAQRSNG